MNLRTRILTALLWLLLPALHALAYDNVDELPSPMDSRHVGYVCNPDGILTPAQVSILNSQLSTLNKRTTVEMAVVVVNSIGDNDPAQFAVDLGTRWGVGKSNDNGVMLLVAMQSHDIALQVGYGAEGALPDILTDRIIRGTMVPLMRKGDTYGAISGAVADVTTIVTDPAAAAELKGDAQSTLKRQNAENERMLLELLSWVVGLSFIAAAGYYVVLSRQSRRLKRDWFSRSKVWRKSLWPMAILCILSAGLGLIFYLLALWRYRYWRTRRRICHRCGSKMHRLDEEKDNAYLNSAQDTEEKLGTVDYDVWLCDRCGEVFDKPFHLDCEYLLATELEDEENDEILLLEDGTVDLGELSREVFILNMPTKLLCREDCRGLCPGCGVNLNYEVCRCKKEVDPRLAKLAQLLEKSENK